VRAVTSSPKILSSISVETAPGHAKNTFSPLRALGAGIDRLESGSTDTLYSKPVLDQVLASGWGTVTYRSNTELHVEAWHWNPKGTWSDAAGRGYFTGSTELGAPIRHSFGYPLPRRGFTHNEGTETVGYSRLTDGDTNSFWKSNPYLSPVFTGESDAELPQWLVVDLGKTRAVNALRVAWAEPYAERYQIEYWTGEDALRKPGAGEWRSFANGAVEGAHGGTPTHRLAAAPVDARFVRITMSDSSETCSKNDAADRRNCVGYAVRELYLGTVAESGEFHDILQHAPSQAQSATACSSVDPWHTPQDLDEKAGDQSGLDLFYTSGATRGLPAMVPVSTLYGTPEDSAAQISYLKKRGYPISHIELGEEPDGQYMTPEHYGALYIQWARALHALDPTLLLGGPAFTGQNEDILAWPDKHGERSWLKRFLGYLKAHGRASDFAFLSFEHYPYEPCKATWDSLYDEPKLISHIMQVFRDDGLAADVPMLITEVNLSWYANQTSVENLAGLWLADYVGAFLEAGGQASYYFHYLPVPLYPGCDGTWGTFGMFKSSAKAPIEQPAAQYWASQLLTTYWAKPGNEPHELYGVAGDALDSAGRQVITAYALKRPDAQWSLMLVNKDPAQPRTIRVAFRDSASGKVQSFVGEVAVSEIGAETYRWQANGAASHADPNGPLLQQKLVAGADTEFVLRPASVTVLRGRLGAPN
jgi:hypothetical protein